MKYHIKQFDGMAVILDENDRSIVEVVEANDIWRRRQRTPHFDPDMAQRIVAALNGPAMIDEILAGGYSITLSPCGHSGVRCEISWNDDSHPRTGSSVSEAGDVGHAIYTALAFVHVPSTRPPRRPHGGKKHELNTAGGDAPCPEGSDP